MTTPAPADPALDAPSLVGTGIDTMAQTAGRLGTTWDMRLATVLVGNNEFSDNVTVITNGDLIQMLTIPLMKRRPVYLNGETVRALQPGDPVYVLNSPTGLFAMPVSPEQEVEQNLLLFDDFNRTETGGWGTPNIGPPWSPSSGMSVVVGSGRFNFAGGSTTAGFAIPPTDVTVFLYNVRVLSTPFTSVRYPLGVYLRGGNQFTEIAWNGNWTPVGLPLIHMENTGDNLRNVCPILENSDPLTPIDIYISTIGEDVQVWGALHSNGINTTAPPNFIAKTTFTSPGTVSLSWNGGLVLAIQTIVIRGS